MDIKEKIKKIAKEIKIKSYNIECFDVMYDLDSNECVMLICYNDGYKEDVLSQPMTEDEYEDICDYIYFHHLDRDYMVYYNSIR